MDMSVSRHRAFSRFLLALGVSLAHLALSPFAWAVDLPVGTILEAHENHLEFKWKAGGSVFDGDQIATRRGQWVRIGFEEGTEVVLGPMSSMKVTNWRGRNSKGYLRRNITLQEGALFANVRHVYSQREPFTVLTPFSAVAVLGTSFVLESGLGYPGQLLRDEIMRKNIDDRLTEVEREKMQKDLESRISKMKTESLIHTLSGAVMFSRSEADLETPKLRVRVPAGYVAATSAVEQSKDGRLVSRPFDEAAFQAYAKKILPKLEVKIDRTVDPAARAALALEQGSYFDWASRGRAIASVPRPKVEKKRRAEFLYTKPSGQVSLRKDGQLKPPEDAFNAK